MHLPPYEQESGRELAVRLRGRWRLIESAANAVGALVVFAYLRVFHAEVGLHTSAEHVAIGTAAFVVYLSAALLAGWKWDERRLVRVWRWLSDDRPATEVERNLVLREPLPCVMGQAALWGGGALLFGALMLTESSHGAIDVALIIALGGVTTCALTYLLIERLLRPATARALASSPPHEPVGLGVSARLITAWALASGVPMLGLSLLAINALGGAFDDAASLAVAVLILMGAGLAAGATGTVLSAYSLADPIAAVRRALGRVRSGDLDVAVTVDDGSEVGLLQAGFNEMVAGLRERERLRDLFGRHVGDEVARRAVESGVELGGETRDVTVMFVDLVGSTALAARRPPEEVVALLNRFFAVVVDVASACGGWVNRFEGDGALCVFGAPTEDPGAASGALTAGRMLLERVRAKVPELSVGIGISGGPAVAGNVGAERRFEYTVIGDPINEAARLCDLAKRTRARILASESTVARASRVEAAHWRPEGEVILRGRTAPTRVATPASEHGPVQAPLFQYVLSTH